MRNLSDAAMAAIEAGEAIVTGGLEIYSRGSEPLEVPGGTSIVLGWLQSGDPFVIPDQGRMGFAFLDSDGDQIGDTVWSPMRNAPPGIWTPYSEAGDSPVGAVTLRVFLEIDRNAGVDATQGFDAISLSVGGNPATLVNAGAEAGTAAGWTIAGLLGPLQAVNSSGALPGLMPYSGSWFFTGGDNSYISAYQDVSLSAFVPVDPVPPTAVLRVWGGFHPIELDGVVFDPIGDRALAQQTSGAIGGIAQGMVLGLSGIEPAVLELLNADEIRGGAAVVRRLIFAPDGKTLLDHQIWDRGRVDTVDSDETVGGEAAIRVGVESAARGLGRNGARMRSDSDQRLIDPNDGYNKNTAYAGEKMLYWGGRRPSRTGDATGGSFGSVSPGAAIGA